MNLQNTCSLKSSERAPELVWETSSEPLSTRRNATNTTNRNRNDHKNVHFWSITVLTLWKQNEKENKEREEETKDPKDRIMEKNIHEHEQVNGK